MTTLKEFEQLFFSRTLKGRKLPVMVISNGYGAAAAAAAAPPAIDKT